MKFDKILAMLFVVGCSFTSSSQTGDTTKTAGGIKKKNGHYRLTAFKYGLDYMFKKQPGIHFGLMQYNYDSFDNYGIHPVAVWGPSVQSDISFDFMRRSPILTSKIGYEYNMIFGLFSGLKLSVGHLTDFRNHTAIVSPEIGICLPGRYGKNVRGSRQFIFGLDIPLLDQNNFPIQYRLTMNINRTLKPRGMS